MATRVMFNRREAALVEQRHEARHMVECVRLTAGGETEEPFAAVLDDISSFGCRLRDAGVLAVGERLWVRLPGAPPIVASVAWARDAAAGCRFAAPISQGLMRSLLPGAA
ncbi:PilZ domain-containing protein [Sphingomonas sp.]|uniref:PilZ domain-containing protein n=1 Tax=Sphingomonas sp. TaxID=28214 RepID=UPI003B00C3B5